MPRASSTLLKQPIIQCEALAKRVVLGGCSNDQLNTAATFRHCQATHTAVHSGGRGDVIIADGAGCTPCTAATVMSLAVVPFADPTYTSEVSTRQHVRTVRRIAATCVTRSWGMLV